MCNVYALHKYFTPGQTEEIYEQCTKGTRGCVDCKDILADGVNARLAELRERRRELEKRPDYVQDILLDGANRAGEIARATLEEVQGKMGLSSVALRKK